MGKPAERGAASRLQPLPGPRSAAGPALLRGAEPGRAVVPRAAGTHLSIRRLEKRYRGREVLRGLSLEIEAGAFVAIVGRSGCGKSTLLKIIAGLEPASGGGLSLLPADPQCRPRVRLMFQEARLLPWKSVLANVMLGLPRSSAAEALAVLREVGLAERAGDWPAQLSGGQRQRVALARALLHRPDLLLVDEPLGALDALTRIEMQELIERLWREHGLTALLVTHDVQEAITLADRILLMDGGAIAWDSAIDLPRPRRRGSGAFARLESESLARVLRGRPDLTSGE